MAGQAAPRQDVLDALVGGDFDPEEYDRQMAAAFGEDYYGAVSALGRLAVGAHCGSAVHAVHAVHAVLCCAVLCCAVLCSIHCARLCEAWCGTGRCPPPRLKSSLLYSHPLRPPLACGARCARCAGR